MVTAREPRLNTKGDAKPFSPFRKEYRTLSGHLSGRVSEIQYEIDLRSLNLELSDREIVNRLTRGLSLNPPAVGIASKRSRAGKHYGRTVHRIALVLPISGSGELVDYWPNEVPDIDHLAEAVPEPESGLDLPPPHWKWNDNGELEYWVEYEGDPPDIRTIFAYQKERVEAIVRAVAAQTTQFLKQYRSDLERWVKEERRKSDAAQELYEAISLPEYAPPQIRITDEPDQSADTAPGPVAGLPPRLRVRDGDWKTYLSIIQRWASVVEHTKGSFCTLDEYALRDLLLATLHAVYPVALGEVMSAGKRSDIYVVPDPDRPTLIPIITELKVGSGSKLVQDAVAQHLGQLSVRETKGTLIFFIKTERRRAEQNVKKGIETSPGFQGWSDGPFADGWELAHFRPPEDPRKFVELHVGSIFMRQPTTRDSGAPRTPSRQPGKRR